MFYIYKDQIRPQTEYYDHIWVGTVRSLFSCIDRVRECLRCLVGTGCELFFTLHPLFHGRNIAITLALFSLQMLGRIIFLGSQDSPCYVYRVDSPYFPSYSIEEKEVPLGRILPQNCCILERTLELTFPRS